MLRVRELPLSTAEIAHMQAAPLSLRTALRDFGAAVRDMPLPMRQLALSMAFQWFAMFAYWQYIAFALARSLFGTADPASPAFRQAVLLAGQVGALYNAIACVAAFAMMPLSRRIGVRNLHALSVALSGAAMIALPQARDTAMLFTLMIGIGIGWASMMGNPYVLLSGAIPPERTGIYMGIFNMFIVLPMLAETLVVPLAYRPLLGGDPRSLILMAGVMMLCAGAATLLVRVHPQNIVKAPDLA